MNDTKPPGYLRLKCRGARRGIAQSRLFRLTGSLMRNQGVSKPIAKELARTVVKQRKP